MTTVGIVGRKVGMTRFYREDIAVPVTVVAAEPNRISQIKNMATDGYSAIQVTAGKKKQARVSKPLAGHFAKASVEAGTKTCEFRLEEAQLADFKVGDEIKVEAFEEGKFVDVSAITKGKGFAGTVKRHNFRTQDATHGNSLSHRAPGSIGQNQSPGKVFKGKKMAGHMGAKKQTIQNLEIVKILPEKNVILIKGALPGANGADVIIRPAVKKV